MSTFLLIMSFYLIAFISLLAFSVCWPLRKLYRNYITARKIGLPVIITPISPRNLWYNLFLGGYDGTFTSIVKRLPFGLSNFINYSGFLFYFKRGLWLREKYGPAFLIVSPMGINVVLSDPDATLDVFVRRKEFAKNVLPAINIFGLNVFSSVTNPTLCPLF